ncbi:hypothetical protein GEMRC1_001943 [Eukaryota sp. GEM-RC1]
MHFVLPGDTVRSISSTQTPIPISSGLTLQNSQVVAQQCGKFLTKGNACVLLSDCGKYLPSAQDLVIGVIVDRLAENFKVDIGTIEYAALPFSEFESYTKKNRPDIPINSLIYARVTLAGKHVEPELSCMSADGKGTGFGHLEGGFLLDVPLAFSRKLLRNSSIIQLIGARLKFEVAVGINGKIWIKADECAHTVFLCNILKIVSSMRDLSQQEQFIEKQLNEYFA